MLTLEDKLELYELNARYVDAMDDRNWHALSSIFTQDAVFEVVGLVTMNGLSEIQHFMAEEGRHPLAHLITNTHFSISSERIEMRSRGIFPIDDTIKEAGHRVFYGSYYDSAVKQEEGWRINHRIFSAKRIACKD